jgi:hypothetical protein
MQVENWNDRGSSVPACAYNSTVSEVIKANTAKDIACGDPMIVYCTPEALQRDEALQAAIQVWPAKLENLAFSHRRALALCVPHAKL